MRISTQQSWHSALTNHLKSHAAQNFAQTQYATQKVSTDLKGFGNSSKTIAAYQANQSQTDSFVDVAKSADARLSAQSVALERLGSAADNTRQEILNALASGRAENLMEAIGSGYSSALDGLNYKHQGSYLFGGGNDNTAPVKAENLTSLSALATSNDAFTNGSLKKTSRIDTNDNLQTGQLASEVGEKLLVAFKALQDYNNLTPLTGKLSDAQKTKLTSLAAGFSSAYSQITDFASFNGSQQKHVENVQASLSTQSNLLETMTKQHTETDIATTYANLQQANLVMQASSQVISTLNSVSLLNYLR